MAQAKNITDLREQVTLVVLLGAPGSGKNKKGQILCALTGHLGLRRIVMSSVIRDHKNRETELGAEFKAQEAIEKAGGLYSDKPVIQAIEPEIMSAYELGGRRIVLDGFPRNPNQQKQFMAWRLPYIVFCLNIDGGTSQQRILERAMKEGARIDDAVAPDRFKLAEKNNRDMLRMFKRSNPKRVISIDGGLPVRDQIMRMLRHLFQAHEIQQFARCLDMPRHQARVIIDDMEGLTRQADRRSFVPQPSPMFASAL